MWTKGSWLANFCLLKPFDLSTSTIVSKEGNTKRHTFWLLFSSRLVSYWHAGYGPVIPLIYLHFHTQTSSQRINQGINACFRPSIPPSVCPSVLHPWVQPAIHACMRMHANVHPSHPPILAPPILAPLSISLPILSPQSPINAIRAVHPIPLHSIPFYSTPSHSIPFCSCFPRPHFSLILYCTDPFSLGTSLFSNFTSPVCCMTAIEHVPSFGQVAFIAMWPFFRAKLKPHQGLLHIRDVRAGYIPRLEDASHRKQLQRMVCRVGQHVFKQPGPYRFLEGHQKVSGSTMVV